MLDGAATEYEIEPRRQITKLTAGADCVQNIQRASESTIVPECADRCSTQYIIL